MVRGQDGLVSAEDRAQGFGHSGFEANWHSISQMSPEAECVPPAERWVLSELLTSNMHTHHLCAQVMKLQGLQLGYQDGGQRPYGNPLT